MNWLQLARAAMRTGAGNRAALGDYDSGLGRLLLFGGLAALGIPAAGFAMLIVIAAGAAAAVVAPFSLFFGLLPQSVPNGVEGPPAAYWSTFEAAQASYRVPMAALLSLGAMTSQFQANYAGPDGNQGIIAMPPSLFLATAAKYSIPLDPGCSTPAEKVNKCIPETTAVEMADPTVEIPVAAAALESLHFVVTNGQQILPGNVQTAITPFVCGNTAPCVVAPYADQLMSDMLRFYKWLTSPTGTFHFVVGPTTGFVWNQTPAGQFPLPAPTSSDPFPWAQCTWWAYYNDPVPGVFGNADQWAGEAARAHVTVIPPAYGPEAGEVVVYGPGGGYSASYGHVAVVTHVVRSSTGAITGYSVSEADVPIGANYGVNADIPWPDPHVMAFLPPGGQWSNPLSSFQQQGA
ncbi:MAG: CHAP domain-containing protein [Candidatus Dormibacteria bacterium]